MNYSVRWSPDKASVAEVAKAMCDIDAQEIIAATGFKPEKAIIHSANNTPQDRIMIVNDGVQDVAVFGILPITPWRSVGWGCVTDKFTFQLSDFASYELRQKLDELQERGVKRFEATVLKSNAKARRFLRNVGGVERQSPEAIGRNNELFIAVIKD